MSIFTLMPIEKEPYIPRDERGRFISKQCSICGNGILKYEGAKFWRCNGLLDIGNDKPLEACYGWHYDGEVEKN